MAGAPHARIRSVKGPGMTADQFDRWLTQQRPELRIAIMGRSGASISESTTDRAFAAADQDGNGRATAEEVATLASRYYGRSARSAR
jgi:hypothetical protein